MADARPTVPPEEAGALALPAVTSHGAQGTAAPYGHRWCPYCGADLSGVPVREDDPQEAAFAMAGRRLKVALAVLFVVIWLAVSLYDWLVDPATNFVPGWYSALGALMLFYLLGFNPSVLLRRRGG